jgi:hypothetical protein
LINALVLAKVMLVAEDLRLDRGLRGQPLAYAAAGEAALLAIVFIVFHVLERLAVGLWHGSTLADSVPAIGGGGFADLISVAAMMFVMLIPYFAFRDLGRALGQVCDFIADAIDPAVDSVRPRAHRSSTFDGDRGNRHAPLPPLRRAD